MRKRGRKYFTKKFRGSGVRYEIGICIRTGDIVWIFGPFLCGKYNDLQIFQMGIMQELDRGEKVIADKIYGAEAPLKVKAPGTIFVDPDSAEMEQAVRTRHEHVNRRFKQWGIMRDGFRHDLSLHQNAFRAVAVMTQLSIANGEPLSAVEYYE